MSAKNESIVRSMVDAIRNADKSKTSPYDTTATVRRVENGIAWVHIPGGVDETPVKLTIAAQPGDTVQVRVSGGRAFLVGNASAPPTDDRTANAIGQNLTKRIDTTNGVLNGVRKVVESVRKIAANTNQYFWHTETGTDTGAHITEIPQEDFLADPEHGGGNLLARSNGIAVRDGMTELATFSGDGFDLYGTQYNTSTQQLEQVELTHLGFGDVYDEGVTKRGEYYTIGTRNSSGRNGSKSISIGTNNTSSGFHSVAVGNDNSAAGICLGYGLTVGYGDVGVGRLNASSHDFVVGIGDTDATKVDGMYMDYYDGKLYTYKEIVPGQDQFVPHVLNASMISIPTGSWEEVATYTIDIPGTYLILYGAAFATNATGYRQLHLEISEHTSVGRWSPSFPAVSGDQTRFSASDLHVSLGEGDDITLSARQNSGSTLDVYGWIKVIKIGA